MQREISEFAGYHESLGKAVNTVYHYRKRLGYFADFLAEIGVREARDVTAEHVRQYQDRLIAAKVRASSRHSYANTIKAFWEWLHKRNRVLADVAARIELPELGKTLPPTPLTPEEVAAVFGTITGDGVMARRDVAMLQVLYACGLRRQELIGLDLDSVDSEAATVFVRGKGDKDRVVPIHQKALAAIQEYLGRRQELGPKKEALFLTSIGQRIHTQTLQQLFARISKALSRRIYPHLMRHTFAVHLLQGGADVRFVQALLGHESPDTTSRYLGLVKDDIKKDYDRAMRDILSDTPCENPETA